MHSVLVLIVCTYHIQNRARTETRTRTRTRNRTRTRTRTLTLTLTPTVPQVRSKELTDLSAEKEQLEALLETLRKSKPEPKGDAKK